MLEFSPSEFAVRFSTMVDGENYRAYVSKFDPATHNDLDLLEPADKKAVQDWFKTLPKTRPSTQEPS